MALVLGDNFSYGGSKPLDARLKYSTTTEMKAVADATMYDGCMAYCSATDKTYQWKSTNTVDETLGKWREFEAGGSTGGGHTIEDSEGTELTQREVLQFGDGFIAEDDTENEKTVISADTMQEEDMDDIITPLPSVGNKMPVLFDESGAERVVGWYIYANGTKKPVYEKKVEFTIGNNRAWTQIDHNIANIETIVRLDTFVGGQSLYTAGYQADAYCMGYASVIKVGVNQTGFQGQTARIILQYTKTTDIAE